MEVALMVTCLGDALFPEVGTATVRLLRRLGVAVAFPAAQTCCGQPHANSGHADDARALARHAIRAFADAERVVVPSASCAAMVQHEYARLFADEPIWHDRAEELAGRTFELSHFLLDVLGTEDVGARFPARATYHMACHLRGLAHPDGPERLLRRVRDLDYVPLDRRDECCGFGGSFSVRFPEISGAMVGDKAAAIERTQAEVVVATDAGCLMNILGCLRRRKPGVRGLHLAQVLAET